MIFLHVNIVISLLIVSFWTEFAEEVLDFKVYRLNVGLERFLCRQNFTTSWTIDDFNSYGGNATGPSTAGLLELATSTGCVSAGLRNVLKYSSDCLICSRTS